MALQILAVNGAILFQPLLHKRAVHVVVIRPALVAGVVGRVNIDALDAPGVAGKERLQGVKVVAVDDEVVFTVLCRGNGFAGVWYQRAVRDGQVVGVDVLLALELKGGHS